MSKKNKHSHYRFVVILLFLFLGLSIFSIIKYHYFIDDSDDLKITFLETGNKYSGDAIYIKAGENDILIDAGSRKQSAKTITAFLNETMTDNTLEYVIATHAHQDHIAGFVGTKSDGGIFDQFECKTIIDFPLTNSTAKIYQDYVIKRNEEISQGAIHYTALECYNNENGASRVIDLGNNIKMEILYNYYYENTTSNENNYSVCILLTQNDKNFLFTGDLEAEGEEYLVQYNNLPNVEVYKAGHHGSYTASSTTLLDVIKPKIVCVCCCAGWAEYTDTISNMFPAQAFISRICHYTDQVYVTTIMTNNGFASMNGNITILSTKNQTIVNCSNNNTILKETEWFQENRKWE